MYTFDVGLNMKINRMFQYSLVGSAVVAATAANHQAVTSLGIQSILGYSGSSRYGI